MQGFSKMTDPPNFILTLLRLHAGQDVSKSAAVGGQVERLVGPNPFHNWADAC